MLLLSLRGSLTLDCDDSVDDDSPRLEDVDAWLTVEVLSELEVCDDKLVAVDEVLTELADVSDVRLVALVAVETLELVLSDEADDKLESDALLSVLAVEMLVGLDAVLNVLDDKEEAVLTDDKVDGVASDVRVLLDIEVARLGLEAVERLVAVIGVETDEPVLRVDAVVMLEDKLSVLIVD